MANPKKRFSARLRVQVRVMSPPPETDEWGDAGTWSELFETRAEVWDTKGTEGVEAMADAARITHKARISFDDRVTRAHRLYIIPDNTQYEIVAVTNVLFKNREIILGLKQL